MMLLYSLVLAVGLLLASPWWMYRMVTTARYREGLKQRLGALPAALRSTVREKRTVWLHAVSVGEVLAASRLVEELGQALGPGWAVVISTTTRTGQTLAKERFGADRVFYMPLDFAWTVRRYLNAIRPETVVLMESELWPRLLDECQRRGIPTVVANARMSDRSFARAMKFRAVWSRVLRKVTLFLAQSRQDADRLRLLGADQVLTTGNVKYDSHASSETAMTATLRKAAEGRHVLIAGSTHAEGSLSEEEIFLHATAHFWHDWPVMHVVAPRHPERFDEVFGDARSYQGAVRASDLALLESTQAQARIVVLDTIGDLASAYSAAEVAFIGGSMVPRGGHNPLEPAQFGVPVVMGPSFENFREIVAQMKAENAITIVQNEQELSAALGHLLEHPEEARAMGERGRQVFESQRGATQRTVEAILKQVQR